MKILIDKYPMGSFKGQRSPGRYIDATYYENLKVLAKNIVNDMTYLAVIYTSTLEVGSGKSTFAQQLAEAYMDLVNQMHGTDLKLTMDNIVFKPEKLIERAFKVPKYSAIILDEWEDAHYWSKLGMTLRQFFRKCRQLNLFIIVIIPNFFEMPMGYAISRSVFAVDCKFKGEFERGHFSFYNFDSKKSLYIQGKKTQNYHCVHSDFDGVFSEGYSVDETEYRRAKRKDMEESEERERPEVREHDIVLKVWAKLKKNLVESKVLSQRRLAEAFGVHENTAMEWNRDIHARLQPHEHS